MIFREVNRKYVEPVAQWTMIVGIAALCQPWIQWLHEWSVTISLGGFVAFIVSIHIPSPEPAGEAGGAGKQIALAEASPERDSG